MQITSMNAAQMALLESFASVSSQEELSGLIKVVKQYYASLLKKEMEQLWDDEKLNQDKLDSLKEEHLRTPYRK